MLKTLVRLWSKLSDRRKRQFFLLWVLMLVAGFAEAVSLGAILPFLAALAAPEKILSHPGTAVFLGALQHIILMLGLPLRENFDPPELKLILAFSFGLAALSSGAIRLLLLIVS